MALVLGLAAALWGLGWALRASVRARAVMVGLLLAGVILGHLVLPDGHPLRAATGGNALNWLLLIGAVAVVLGYRAVLLRLKARAVAREPEAAPAGTFRPAELERYARHIMLREIGGPGQKALKNARVLVIGAGGLGSPALLYLAAAGVGTIGVIDDDVVDASNLQRQVIHADDRIGMAKVASAAQAMLALNPHVAVRPYQRRLTDEIAAGPLRRLRSDPRRIGQFRHPLPDQPGGGGNRQAADRGGDHPVGGADQPLRSRAWHALLRVHLPDPSGARAGADLRRGRGGGPAAGRDRRDDGAGGGQAPDRGRADAARARCWSMTGCGARPASSRLCRRADCPVCGQHPA